MPPKNNLLSFEQAKKQMASLIAAYTPSKSVVDSRHPAIAGGPVQRRGFRGNDRIERIEIRINPVDMLTWLSVQQDDVKIYGANQSDTVSIAGFGEAVCVTGKRKGSLKKIFKQLRSYLTKRYPYLQWYGGFCFDDRHVDADWEEFGAYRFVLPRFELAAQGDKMIFCCNLRPGENAADILKQLNEIAIPYVSSGGRWERGIPSERRLLRATASVRYEDRARWGNPRTGPDDMKRVDRPDQKLWHKDVDKILADRSVEKVVLARKTSLDFRQALDPWLMLRQLKKVTPNSYHFAFQFKKTVFLGASPERLYQRHGRFIESEALAGTVAKTVDPKILRTSPKNQYEHAVVVDAVKAVFEKFCTAYTCQRAPSILTLPSGHHLITKFQGQLKDGVNDEDILQFLHPTPALGGTPRARALEIIRKLEGFSRGWYGAPLGYVGLDGAEFVVGIRSGLACGKKLSVFAGAGIVQGSKPASEWDEVENKISNFIRIIR